MDTVDNFTVDFIIRYKTGTYMCKRALPNIHRMNHLRAHSFDTKDKAKLVAGGAEVLKRTCKLEPID